MKFSSKLLQQHAFGEVVTIRDAKDWSCVARANIFNAAIQRNALRANIPTTMDGIGVSRKRFLPDNKPQKGYLVVLRFLDMFVHIVIV